jgi:hypothetical protein
MRNCNLSKIIGLQASCSQPFFEISFSVFGDLTHPGHLEKARTIRLVS